MAHRRTWLALILAAMASPAVPAAGVEHRVRLAPLAGGLWTVPVTLDQGTRPLRFLVDTGCDRSVVSRAAARRAGLAVVEGARLGTPAGVLDAGQTVVERLAVGPMTLAKQQLLVADLATVGRGTPPDGLLGMDVLGARDVVLDFDRGLLTLSDGGPGPAAAGVSLSMQWSGGRVVLDARVDGRARTLVLDTGAETLVVFEASSAGRAVGFAAAGGTGVGRLGRAEVALGPLPLGVVPVLRIAPSAPRGSDGMLPASAFKRIHIDRDAGQVHVVPRRR